MIIFVRNTVVFVLDQIHQVRASTRLLLAACSLACLRLLVPPTETRELVKLAGHDRQTSYRDRQQTELAGNCDDAAQIYEKQEGEFSVSPHLPSLLTLRYCRTVISLFFLLHRLSFVIIN
jgi:hypothetical protein